MRLLRSAILVVGFVALAAGVVLRAEAGLAFFQKNYAEMGQVPNTQAGICAAASAVNSFIYLRNHYPEVYGNTNLLPDWNGDGQLTQADYISSRDKIADGWQAGTKVRLGMYLPSSTAKTIWEATYYWLEDFAPGTSVMNGRIYTNSSVGQWAGGQSLQTSNPWYPQWDFLWDSLVAAQDVTLGLSTSSGPLHSVALTGLGFDDLDGDGRWDVGETPLQIGFGDPNNVGQQTWADVTIGFLKRVEFTWQNGDDLYSCFIYRVYTEGPIIPEPATTVSLAALLAFGVVQWRRRRRSR